MLNLLAAAAISANPKEEAMQVSAANQFFEPFPALPWLTGAFFILSCFMVWLMVRAGKGADYNS